MTWNVHNLFDGVDNGYEYDEFLQSAGWSTEKYLGRINSMAAAIGRLTPVPDIILFQEIESHQILEDFATALSQDYAWSHFANNPNAAVGLGILSRFPLMESRTHSIAINGDVTPRPVLETRILTEGGSFVIFTCHWKSKIGGDDETEDVRKASARVILRRIRELWETEPDTGLIVAGDLNENHDEFYRRGSNIVCALLPDDPYSAILSNVKSTGQKDFIVVSGNKPPVSSHFPQGTISLFSPWVRELDNGSYFYRYNWETIDNILLSHHFFNGSGWNYERAYVANFEPFANSNGIPVPYNPKTGLGFSDHLPLLIYLKFLSSE